MKKKTTIQNKNLFSKWKNKLGVFFLFLFILFLPTQFGKHFFFNFSYVNGVRVDFLAPTIYITDLLFIVLSVIFLKEVLNTIRLQAKPLILILLISSIIIFKSLYPIFALYSFLKLSEIYVVYIIFSLQNKLKTIHILTAFTLGAVFELTLSIAQLYSGSSLQGIFYFFGERYININLPSVALVTFYDKLLLRPYATFSHPNSMAGFYLLIYTAFLFLFITKKQKVSKQVKRIVTLLLFCSGTLILLSFSKVAIAGFILISSFFLLRMKGQCAVCAIAKISLVSVISLFFTQGLTDPLSLVKRVQLFQNSIAIFSKNIIFGVGFGHYIYWQSKFASPYSFFLGQPVHNVFLLILTQAGIIFSAILAVLFYLFINRNLKRVGFASILFAIIWTGFFDHYWLTLQQNMLLIGVIFAIVSNNKFIED